MPVSMRDFGLDRLSVTDRISLVEELWDSIAMSSEPISLTDAQKQDLQRRIDLYRDDPNAGSSWEEVRSRLVGDAD